MQSSVLSVSSVVKDLAVCCFRDGIDALTGPPEAVVRLSLRPRPSPPLFQSTRV
jgi:hypothetical protein